MKIATGLFDHMVLQRTGNDKSDALITGTCRTSGTLNAVVTGQSGQTREYTSCVIGRAWHKKFQGRLRGLPAGGPYDVCLTVKDSAGTDLEKIVVRDVLVGDVWMLAGQSNMQGIGRIGVSPVPHRLVRAMYMNDEWDVARDPIHNLDDAVDTVHSGWTGPHLPRPRTITVKSNNVGAGPGPSFAREMLRRTGVPQGLLPCAHGGTAMSAWNPKYKNIGTRSLYGAMLRRFIKSGARIAGVLWYQGESDTGEQQAAEYPGRMKKLVAAVRRDFNDKNLNWVIVQLATVTNMSSGKAVFWNRIQEYQRLLPYVIKNLLTVPAVDLALDDSIHIAGNEMPRLGCRLAQAMCGLKRVKGSPRPPIEPYSIKINRDHKYNCFNIVLKFKNVVGNLRATGQPSGFSLTDDAGTEYVCRTELRGNEVILRTTVVGNGMILHYGRGTKPHCNITDKADRSLPVFGPLTVTLPEIRRDMIHDLGIIKSVVPSYTDFARRAMVSCPQPAPADISKLVYPAEPDELGFKARCFSFEMWNLHLDLFKCESHDLLVYFACQLVCGNPMSLNLGIGYDGPIKVWINGKEIFCDPKGTNPALADKALVPFDAVTGRHEVLFAMTSNHGRAWGIKFRCHKRETSRRPTGVNRTISKRATGLPKITI